MATSKAHLTCHCMSQLSDSSNLLTLSSHQPISNQLSHEQSMIETECPTSKRQRQRSLLSILFQINSYVIDLINFDLNYLNNCWHPIFKKLHFTTLCFKYYMLQFLIFQIHQLLQNGKPKQKHQFKSTATNT